jgi:hypothetical protein
MIVLITGFETGSPRLTEITTPFEFSEESS